MPPLMCKECKKKPAQTRGICGSCKYKADKASGKVVLKPKGRTSPNTEAMEELDRQIEEQMKPENLPDWWDYEDAFGE